MENLINIGTIVGTHHLRGSVKINSIFENIEIIENERVLLEKNEKKKLLVVKKVKRLNEKKAILDFEGIENIDEAKELNGYKVKIRRDLLPERNENEFYIKDLFGIEVFFENEKIGEVVDVMETAAHNILIIEDIETKKESVVSPELEIKLINQKIDNYFDKIDKLELRRKELEKRIFIKKD